MSESRSGPRGSRAVPPLFGRGPTLDGIERFLSRAPGRGGTLVLVGDPGAGKTAVLDAAARAATDAVVLRAEGVEFEAELSFSGLHQVLLPLAGEIATAAPAHRAALSVTLGLEDGPTPPRAALHEAVLALLRRAARTRRVLVLVDDLQWVDRASVGVLRRVGQHLDGTPVGLLVAVRSGHTARFSHPGFTEHELAPLDDRAATDLLHAHFPGLGRDRRELLVAEAQGNPLALLELASSTDSTARGAPHPAAPTPHSHLHRLFAARLGDLPGTARRFVLLAALEGSADLDVLLAALPPSDRECVPETADVAGLVHIDRRAGTVRFRHPIVRTVVVDLATSSEYAHAHRTLAGLLSDRPGRQAWHLAGAARGPDEHVARALQDAALDSLRRGDSAGAVATLMRAAELTPPGPGRAQRIARAAQIGAEVTGDLRAVPRLLGDAKATDPHVTTSLRGVAAAAHLVLNGDGDVDTAFRLLIEALTARSDAAGAGAALADDGLDEALYTLLMVCTFGCRPELWARFHATLARLRPHVPALFELCVWSLGDAARTPAWAIDRLLAGVDRLRHETDPLQIVRISMAAFYAERWEQCRDALWRVVRDGRSGGATASAINALMILASDAFHTGRWDEARDLAAEGLALCDAHGYQLLAAPGRLCLALLAAARGDGPTVRSLTDEMITWGVPRGARKLVVYAGEARALAALGRGDFEDAYAEAAAVGPPGALEPGNGHLLWMTLDLVEAAARTHRHAEAAAHVAVLREVGTARLGTRHALLAAGAAAIAAPDHLAGDLYEAALALDGAEGWPFDLARVRLAYGEHLRRSRATTAAREQLSRALATFTDLGARPWAARATTELRAAGHDPARGPGRASLTPQELEVAGLAASGMTNRQIADRLQLSRRTVDAHLYRVFPKLHITGRAALRDALELRRG